MFQFEEVCLYYFCNSYHSSFLASLHPLSLEILLNFFSPRKINIVVVSNTSVGKHINYFSNVIKMTGAMALRYLMCENRGQGVILLRAGAGNDTTN